MPMIVTNPNVTRSRLVLEVASEMIGGNDPQEQPDYYGDVTLDNPIT